MVPVSVDREKVPHDKRTAVPIFRLDDVYYATLFQPAVPGSDEKAHWSVLELTYIPSVAPKVSGGFIVLKRDLGDLGVGEMKISLDGGGDREVIWKPLESLDYQENWALCDFSYSPKIAMVGDLLMFLSGEIPKTAFTDEI